MGDWLKNTVDQIGALPRQRQLILLCAAIGSVSFFAWITLGLGNPNYQPLFRGLEEEEAARIVDALRAERIDYRLSDGATSILVPAEQIHEARIRVAGKGLPGGGSSGFELFDRPAFGVTDFVHKVNYARAVQGELARSIEQLESVERARVQVVIPERGSVLAATKRKPSAAVVLRLAPGRELGAEQSRAIANLVASSIQSLDPSEVTIVDNAGRMLAPLGEESRPGALAPSGAREHQARVESDLAARIESILEPVVGHGGVVARVSADMDWTESEVTEERFDPNSQVARSESRTDEIEGQSSDGGAPGITANAPGLESIGTAPGPPSSSRTTETFNYEISKKVSHSVTATGAIQRLSVAVLVDAGRVPSGNTPEGEEPVEAWAPEELERFEELARQAVGFSEERGDRIVVSSSPFQAPELTLEEGGLALDPRVIAFGFQGLRILGQLLALVLFFSFVIKPLLGTVADAAKSAGTTALPASVSTLEAQLDGAVAPDLAVPPPQLSLAEQVSLEAGSRSEDSVTTIRNWLNQG